MLSKGSLLWSVCRQYSSSVKPMLCFWLWDSLRYQSFLAWLIFFLFRASFLITSFAINVWFWTRRLIRFFTHCQIFLSIVHVVFLVSKLRYARFVMPAFKLASFAIFVVSQADNVHILSCLLLWFGRNMVVFRAYNLFFWSHFVMWLRLC